MKIISGLITVVGLVTMFGAVGGIEAETIGLLIGTPLAFGGALTTFVGLELLNRSGVNVWE